MIEALIGLVVGVFLAIILHYFRSIVGTVEINHPIGNRIAFLRYFEEGEHSFWYHDTIEKHTDSRTIRTLFVPMQDRDIAVFITGSIQDPSLKVEYTFIHGRTKFTLPMGQSINDYLKAKEYEKRNFVFPKYFRDFFLH